MFVYGSYFDNYFVQQIIITLSTIRMTLKNPNIIHAAFMRNTIRNYHFTKYKPRGF